MASWAWAVKNKKETSLLSVVIPTLNAEAALPGTLAALRSPIVAEVIVADGGSGDGTRAVAAGLGAMVIGAPSGRGAQIAAGIARAKMDWVMILHADTRLSPGWDEAALRHVQTEPNRAGYFRFALDSADPRARRLERVVRWRCRVLALPYGDQGLLIRHDLLRDAGGFRPIPLMEDVDLVRRLGRARLSPLDADAVTSAIRWEREGWLLRSARNLACLSLWFAGVPPRALVRFYS